MTLVIESLSQGLGGGDLTTVTVVSKLTAVFRVSLESWSARHGRAGDAAFGLSFSTRAVETRWL